MLQFWGDGSIAAMDLVDAVKVRSTENFNWTFIFILAVVFYIYWSEIHKKKMFGLDKRITITIMMALLFALFESFLAGTSNHSFIWVYK